jgi:glutamyl endopeptidase
MPARQIGVAAAVAAAILVFQPAATWAAGETAVSDDGGGLGRSAESGGTVWRSYKGLGRESQDGAAEDGLATLKSVPESAEDVWKLWSLQPATAPEGRESIIGPDTRKQVTNTKKYPYRAVVLITFENSRCTGWLISKDTVATAGHCVHQGNGGRWYDRSTYRLYAGRDGNKSPYGSCRAKRLYSNAGWTNDGLSTHDYGAIKLDCSIGKTVGWFGFFWQSGSLNGLPTTIPGYPGDKPLTQWYSTGKVTVTHTNEVFYKNDTVGGMSGSPVYYDRKNCGTCSMAVHAYGTYNGPPYSDNNHGTRITKAVFDNFKTWIAAK